MHSHSISNNLNEIYELFNNAREDFQNKEYSNAHANYLAIQENLKGLDNLNSKLANSIRSELGQLACELSLKKISLTEADERYEMLSIELNKIVKNFNACEENYCKEIFDDLKTLNSKLNYHLGYSENLFNDIQKNHKTIKLSEIKNAADNIDFTINEFEKCNRSTHRNKSKLNDMSRKMNKTLADRLIKESLTERGLVKKINYLNEAITHFKVAITRLDAQISSFSEYASQAMPLYLGILEAYKLLIDNDKKSSQIYAKKMELLIEEGDLKLNKYKFEDIIHRIEDPSERTNMQKQLTKYSDIVSVENNSLESRLINELKTVIKGENANWAIFYQPALVSNPENLSQKQNINKRQRTQ